VAQSGCWRGLNHVFPLRFHLRNRNHCPFFQLNGESIPIIKCEILSIECKPRCEIANTGIFMNTAEFQLLVYCARSEPDVGTIRDLVNKGITWERLLELAQHHGVRPVLCQSLKSACWDSVPQTIRLELDRFYKANAERSLLFAGELLRLVGIFQQTGIPIAAFKGAVLAESIYGDLCLREFTDLDVIVHSTDVSKAEDILSACGYQAQFTDRDFRSTFLSHQGQYAFRHPQTGTLVDLHWRLSWNGEPFPLESAELWSRLGEAVIAGRKVPTLVCEDLALLLAAHGTKEGWKYLKWLCDFAELVRKCRSIDWVLVFERAKRSNCLRSLQLAIVLASTLLNAPAPLELIDKARNDPAVLSLAERALLRMLRTNREGELTEFLNGLDTHDRLRHRLLPVVTFLLRRTVGDYRAMPLPKSLWKIYYLTRPLRLGAKAAQLLLRRN
jgi:hypothetical protein